MSTHTAYGPSFEITNHSRGCALKARNLTSYWELPLPIMPEDARALILACFRAPENATRVELGPEVCADQMADGVRVHDRRQSAWFDVHWTWIARNLL